jgi:hypothetical protein
MDGIEFQSRSRGSRVKIVFNDGRTEFAEITTRGTGSGGPFIGVQIELSGQMIIVHASEVKSIEPV